MVDARPDLAPDGDGQKYAAKQRFPSGSPPGGRVTRRRFGRAVGVATLLGWLCGVPPATSAEAHPGRVIAQSADCAVCHVVPEVADPGRLASCTGCHAWVHTVAANPTSRTKAMQYFPKWERYETNVRTYAAVPDLGAAFARLEPEWLASYLADPYDLRPGMPETMVRVGLDKTQIRSIADWAATQQVKVAATPLPTATNLVRGEQLFTEKACGTCHVFGGRHTTGVVPAAPDLRWARDRMSDDMIVAWIVNPADVSPSASMPSMGVSNADAIALRDYIVLAEPGGKAPKPLAAAVPFVGTPTWSEVESRVFGKICTHCHMDPAQNEGRAGPGNAGGFGWAATGLELQTYESVAKNGPAILAAIQRRKLEESRDHVAAGEVPQPTDRPELPGMPLGLPTLPAEDIALVEAWYSAGAPR